MRRLTAILLLTALAGCSSQPGSPQAGHAKHGGDPHAGHAEGHAQAALMVQTEPATPAAGQPAALKLMIHDATGAMVKDFAVVHEQKVHLIIVRDGLDQFAHLHPAVDAAGHLTARHTFPTGGTYHLYADYQQPGKAPAVATATVAVAGDRPPAPALAPDVPGVAKGDGLHAKVAVENAKAGGVATLRFELTDAAGQPATDLQPYLGAMGHLVVLSADAKQYVHAHPMEGQTAARNQVAFQAHFPRAGLYKGWAQFRRGDQVHTVPFVVRVDGSAGATGAPHH